ncbi:hypothetical protein CFC21_064278, partial [Triticum aestivum]
FI